MNKKQSVILFMSAIFNQVIFSAMAQRYHNGESELHHVAQDGNYARVEQLLDAGVPVDLPDRDGTTPLCYACYAQKENSEVIQLLLERGADSTAHGFSAPHRISSRLSGYTVSDPWGPPLFIVVEQGLKLFTETMNGGKQRGKIKFRTVKLLLEFGADVDVRFKGVFDCYLQYYRDYGCDLEAMQKLINLLTLEDLIQLPGNESQNKKDFKDALYKSDFAKAKWILATGIDFNLSSLMFEFPDLVKVQYFRCFNEEQGEDSDDIPKSEVARFLVEHGCSVNTQNRHGERPLGNLIRLACPSKKKTALVGELLALGARAGKRYKSGNTLLHFAVDQEDAEVVALLLTHRKNELK